MTVGSKVKETLAGLKGARATMEAMVMFEQNPDDKKVMETNLQRIKQVIEIIENRLSEIEYQEPEFKGF